MANVIYAASSQEALIEVRKVPHPTMTPLEIHITQNEGVVSVTQGRIKLDKTQICQLSIALIQYVTDLFTKGELT